MDYQMDTKAYMDGGLGFRTDPNNAYFGSQQSANAFAPTARSVSLSVLDSSLSNRQSSGSFSSNGSFSNGQSGQGLNMNMNAQQSIMSDPNNYAQLGMNAFDQPDAGGTLLGDWNPNANRPLGSVDPLYRGSVGGTQQQASGIFTQSVTNGVWANGNMRGSNTEAFAAAPPLATRSYSLSDVQSATPSANSVVGGAPMGGAPMGGPAMGGPPMGGPAMGGPAMGGLGGQKIQQFQRPQHSQRFDHGRGGGGGQQRYQGGSPGTGGSNAQGRALNKMLLDILRERNVDPNRLAMAIDANIERMDCVNLATLLFHTGKKRLLLTPSFIKRIALRFGTLKEELRAREASNALYGLKCMSSECPEVRQLVFALANKVGMSQTELVAQAVGNALYGCQMMTSEHEEVRYLLQVLAVKVSECTELLEAQNVGNALYGLRGMNSDCKEVRLIIGAITPKVATAREELNGQALGNSLYGLQGMNSREPEVRNLLSVLAVKVARTWENLKAQEVGNALYGLKRMNSDVAEVRHLLEALMPKVAASPEILDAQAIGNSFYGMQNMKSDNAPVLALLATMADKVLLSPAELDGQAMGNSLYGLQGMRSDKAEVRAVVNAITLKIQSSCLEMNAQELGNALYGLQNMISEYPEVRRLMQALTVKVSSSTHELTSQEIGNAIFGLQGMRSDFRETRMLVSQMATKIQNSTSLIDPQGIANSLFGMQKMTSESEEVRALIVALANKIEQSWKLLSPQHISNSIFGVQGLCSNEPEVRALVHTLVPKVLASRDEMTPKQACNSLYGLKNMYASHDEVRMLLGPITEKIRQCSDTMPLQFLAAAFFGVQGMESSYEEMSQLINVLCEKLTLVDVIDVFSLGNIFFGLQRMSTEQPEVVTLVELLKPMVATLVDCGLDINAQVCANILYGLQNCSCEEEAVRKILEMVASRTTQLLAPFTCSSNTSTERVISFDELLCLYQAYSISIQALPNLDDHSELKDELVAQQESLYATIQSHESEFTAKPLSALSMRLKECLADVLADEPFIVTSGELLNAFEASIVIRLRNDVTLTSEEGAAWSPIVNIEVSTGGDKTPAKTLFNQQRKGYLAKNGIDVESVPISAICGLEKPELREYLRKEASSLFRALTPPEEDAEKYAATLSSMGMAKAEGILSSVIPGSEDLLATRGDTSSMSSFFSGANDVIGDDDEFGEDFLQFSGQNVFRKTVGVLMGWIGDTLVPTMGRESPHGSSPATTFSPAMALAGVQKRVPQPAAPLPGSNKTVGSSPMPPGYSSRTICPPFVQIGPPPAPATDSPLVQKTPSLSIDSDTSTDITSAVKDVAGSTLAVNAPVFTPSGAGANLVAPLSQPGELSQMVGMGKEFPGDSNQLTPVASFVAPAPDAVGGSSDGSSISPGAVELLPGEVDGEGNPPNEGGEVDDEIALLEAQLEIKRLEAKLLLLKKKTGGK